MLQLFNKEFYWPFILKVSLNMFMLRTIFIENVEPASFTYLKALTNTTGFAYSLID